MRIGEACTACGACLATCPERALHKAPKRPLVVDAACTGCWACIEICPAGAIVSVPGSPEAPVHAEADRGVAPHRTGPAGAASHGPGQVPA